MEYAARTRRWTRAEYDRLIEVGVFRPGEPLELLAGELVVGEPQRGAHYTAIYLFGEALRAAFGPGWLVRSQAPIALDDESGLLDRQPGRPRARGLPPAGSGPDGAVRLEVLVTAGARPRVVRLAVGAPNARVRISDLLP